MEDHNEATGVHSAFAGAAAQFSSSAYAQKSVLPVIGYLGLRLRPRKAQNCSWPSAKVSTPWVLSKTRMSR